MAARQIKCKHCDQEDKKENLKIVQIEHHRVKAVRDKTTGKIIHNVGDVYYSNIKLHVDCEWQYFKDKEDRRIEEEKKDKLSFKIAEVYGLDNIQLIPNQIWPFIQDIRNDSKLFGKLGKNYKKGIPYEGIALTFEYCKEKIKEAHRIKEFKDFQMELRYGLAIVKNNLVDAKNEYEMLHRQQKSLDIKKSIEFISTETEEESPKYIKNENEDDISDLLD